MKLHFLTKIKGDQDGAIFGSLLFRLNDKGECWVYDLAKATLPIAQPLDVFTLDRADEICPHSNAVVFGGTYYYEGDEFPLLYTNIYNNYAGAEDPMHGVCCVYRVQRQEGRFTSTMVQIIRVGFVNDPVLWCSGGETKDVRPYGNFVVDPDGGKLYAFVMRDAAQTTRYFAFRLPEVQEGEMENGVRVVTLQPEEVLDSFDCPYHRYLQGACFRAGKIYSVEGFSYSEENPAVLRVMDVEKREQTLRVDLREMGYPIEPEFVDFWGERCIYGDNDGNLYEVEFACDER